MAKRISSSSVNWTAIAERVPPPLKDKFTVFKSKSDNYLRRVVVLPENAPKIDWSFYKANVAAPGLVENFQKSYDALKIPYPSDQGRLGEIDKQESEFKSKLAKYIEEQRALIEKTKVELAEKEKEPQLSTLSMEEICILRPELGHDPDKPTLWPHDEEAIAYSEELRKKDEEEARAKGK